ncbi:TetR/AcrR family transcriptional regulator [Agromyces larvae]|uniref:TetR/AcrR family transcriptional regulator n=1 Tax=Agromyces larvae TaxID=2929802 RepID=A0ABY4BZ68_9MICO|nr:TetR/AcrR family transcriptional regulator [Agromyces larvae]UOE43018.1 TetR/AcrR family transcriptional regulator [Agromyces larvae]
MSSATSNRRDARRNHARLIEEAKRLFTERGIDAPLDELAARAGVGAGTVYRHFANRDALIRELYDSAIAMFHDLGPEIVDAPTGWEAIELFLERLGAWVADTPYLPALMRRVAELDPDYRPGLEFESIIDGIIERAIAEGSLRPDVTSVDLNILTNMLGSLGQFGGATLSYQPRQLRIILDGLRARPGLAPLPGAVPDFGEFHDAAHRRDLP